MRLSIGSVRGLAEISPLFLGRAGAAILLALAIISTENLHLAGFAGLLGFYAIADGVFAAIIWLRDRRFKLFAGEAIAGIVLGFAMLLVHGSAIALLVLVALRAIALACVDALHARATLTPRDARISLVFAAACGQRPSRPRFPRNLPRFRRVRAVERQSRSAGLLGSWRDRSGLPERPCPTPNSIASSACRPMSSPK